MGRLQDKVALITGGAQGIGKATAIAFTKEGAKVVIADMDEAKGEALAAELVAQGHEAIFCKLNVADRAQAQHAADATVAKFGQIDILVNNAGITRDASMMKMTEEQFDQVIAVNLKGVYNMTQAVAPSMVARQYGRILNAASVVALYGNFGQTNYVATKAAVIGMTKTWAREFGRKGITVNAVAPGFIATDMVATMPEQVLSTMKDRSALQRLGKPEDIAAAYLFLASDEASFITGTVLSVDGGLVS
jgi:3-oxoacyl-[acyl-carrier protein] reductase